MFSLSTLFFVIIAVAIEIADVIVIAVVVIAAGVVIAVVDTLL